MNFILRNNQINCEKVPCWKPHVGLPSGKLKNLNFSLCYLYTKQERGLQSVEIHPQSLGSKVHFIKTEALATIRDVDLIN